MLELLDEIISSSPEPKKRLSDSISYRKTKRKRRNEETANTTLHDRNSTIILEANSIPELKPNLDLNDIYWEDDNDCELEFIHSDIFAEEKLLEKANLQKTNDINNYEKFITDSFETATEFSQKFNYNDFNKSKQGMEILDPETQFVISPTTFENVCNQVKKSGKEAVQVDDDIYDPGAGCSKFISPIKESTIERKSIAEIPNVVIPGPVTQFGISESQFVIFCEEIEDKVDRTSDNKVDCIKMESAIKTPKSNDTTKLISSIAQSIFDDFNELEDPSIISSLIKQKPINDFTPKFQFRNKPLRTYSRNRITKLNTLQRPTTAINLETIYDSDSSHSSGLSIQRGENNLNIKIEKEDKFNIKTSQQLCENILNLSTFFSNSFVDENENKIKKKIIKRDRNWMLNYFRTKRNFQFSTSIDSDEEFLGFPDSDDENGTECLSKDGNLDIQQVRNEVLSQDNCKGFTQALLDKSFIDIDHQILIDSISKDEISAKKMNSPKIFQQNLLKKPPEVHNKGYSNQFSINCNQNPSLEISYTEDKINDDIFNSELWQDEDLLIGIKSQNLIEKNNNKIELTEKDNRKCQIPLKSKFNGQQSARKYEMLNESLAVKSHEIIGNQICNGFKFASNKPVTISKNALKQAQKLITEVLNEDITIEAENKENHSVLKEVKFKTASDKSIKINDDALLYAKEFLNGIDMDSFTNNFDFDCDMTKNAPKNHNLLNSNTPKKRLLEANNFLNGISAEITSVETSQFVSFKSGLGKPINISDKSLLKAKRFINETNKKITEELLKTDDNFKVPIFEGFKSANGKAIEISESALEKATKIMKEINNEIIIENANMNSCEENKLQNCCSTKHENIELNCFQKSDIQKTTSVNKSILTTMTGKNLNSYQESDIKKTTLTEDKNITVGSNSSILKNGVQKRKKITKNSKKISQPSEIYPRRITRLSARINNLINSTIESTEVDDRPSMINNIIHQENIPKFVLKDINNSIVKNISSPELSKSRNCINKQKELTENSLNNLDTTISTPLSHKTTISRSQLLPLTPLGTRKNILSLSNRNFKPPATITPSRYDENFCTPLRNLEKNANCTNHIETPNLKEFFNSVNSTTTSTPNISSQELPLTKEITPSTIVLMENEMKNSFIDEDMNLINWSEVKTTNNSREISLSQNLSQSLINKTLNRISPSPKMRIDRLKIWNKPPALLPIAFIDNCKPSGLTRKNKFLSKLETQTLECLELQNEMN